MFYNLGTLLHQILAMALAVNFMLIGRYHPWVTSFISKASVAIEIGGCSDLNLHPHSPRSRPICEGNRLDMFFRLNTFKIKLVILPQNLLPCRLGNDICQGRNLGVKPDFCLLQPRFYLLRIFKIYLLLSPSLYSSPSHHYLSFIPTPRLFQNHMAARMLFLKTHIIQLVPSLLRVTGPFPVWPLPLSGLSLCCCPPHLWALVHWFSCSSLNSPCSPSAPTIPST